MSVEIKVPTLGESVSEATVAQWLKKPGEAVAMDEPLVELETDKVTLEVNATAAGTLSEIVVDAGGSVEVGAVLGYLEAGDAPAVKASAPTGGAAAKSESVDVVVPVLGESVTEATVGTWQKSVGDAVAADELLVELETDKVTLEVNAPAAGTLSEIVAAEGATVEIAAVLARIAAGEGAVVSTPAPAAPSPAAATPAAPAPEEEADQSGSGIVMPAAAKLLADYGLPASAVKGTGKGGRVTKEDVQAFIASGKAPRLAAAAATGGGSATTLEIPAFERPATQDRPQKDREERVRMTKLRKTIARRLKDAQNTAAMLTTFNEVDMGALMTLRRQYKDQFEKKHGVRLGFMSFFAKACVNALQELPAVNAEIDGEDIVYKNYYDIGVAVGTPNGLVVPVVRDCDTKSFADIEGTINDYGKRARDGKLTMAEMTGGTFTITNGGVFGSLMSTPILNPPQSAILGMHKIQERPMAVGGKVEIRPMMYLALSYDHRIIDGREAVTFLVRVKDALEDPGRLLLDV